MIAGRSTTWMIIIAVAILAVVCGYFARGSFRVAEGAEENLVRQAQNYNYRVQQAIRETEKMALGKR